MEENLTKSDFQALEDNGFIWVSRKRQINSDDIDASKLADPEEDRSGDGALSTTVDKYDMF